MFAGHFGLAAAVKAKNPREPVWALMLSTQLMDVVFVPLLLAGVEWFEPLADTGHGQIIIHADYSHSLVGALLLAGLAGTLAGRAWGKRSGLLHAAVVFSHWLLDLLVHRADMPILPGNLGDLPLLGLGLWRWPAASIGVEAFLLLLGGFLYLRAALDRAQAAGPAAKGRAIVAGSVMAGLLGLSLITDLMGLG